MLRFLFGTGVLCVLALSWLPLQLQAQSTPTAAQQMNLQSVANVNMAGRQRMLAQRMTKAYLMLGQSIDPEGAQAILQESIRLFDAQLDALKSLPPNAAQAKSLAELDAVWARCKPLLTAYPTKLGADLLYDLSEELQQAAHHVTLGYRNAGILPLDQLVNLAGRHRPRHSGDRCRLVRREPAQVGLGAAQYGHPLGAPGAPGGAPSPGHLLGARPGPQRLAMASPRRSTSARSL